MDSDLKLQQSRDGNIGDDEQQAEPSTVSQRNRLERARGQGPWNQKATPELLAGAPSLPMPVKIADPANLEPFFEHIAADGRILPLIQLSPCLRIGHELNYQTPYVKIAKGVIYEDARMDLCRMDLGPPNIVALVDALEHSSFIKHLLLGNDIVGHAGCRRINESSTIVLVAWTHGILQEIVSMEKGSSSSTGSLARSETINV